jgi:DNA-binding beta-propeller fold protein YncE
LIFAIFIGFSELLLLKPLLLWLPVRWWVGKKSSEVSIGWLPALILVPGLAAFLLDPYSLSDFHRSMFPDPAVHQFARDNFSWTELDLNRRILYASGYGTKYLQAYNIDALDRPPLVSPVENGYAQGFAYNPQDREIYIYNMLTHQLLTLDATTLNLKKSVATSRLSPGDVWTAWDKFSDSIVLASEADEQVGIPTIFVDQTDGQLLDQLNFDPGNIALHPTKPWLYLSFLRRINEVLVYDLDQHQIVRRASVPQRLDRLIFAPGENGLELFASAPLASEVMRFDAETLDRQETIKTGFGGRAIAVDSTRHWLLCGSLVTHQLEVIDLTTRQRIAEYYLGPWLRTIVLDSDAGIAYVSSHGGLFTVQYAAKP